MLVKNKYLLIIGLVILVLAAVSIFNPLDNLLAKDEASGRIAFVDVQAVFNIHPDKKISEEKLNKIAQSMQSELEKKAEDLPKDKQQDMVKDYQAKLTQQEQEFIQQILAKIDKAIKKVAEQKGVRLVLDKKNVIYGGYDMTQDVIDYIKSNTDKNTEKTTDQNTDNTKKNSTE